MRPRTVVPRAPDPSKRTSLRASVLLAKTRPSVGCTARLKSVVPRPATRPVTAGVAAVASMANRSWSGSVKRTFEDQSRPASSRQTAPTCLTMSPVPGAATPSMLVVGPGLAPESASRCSTVVRLPDMKGAA